MKMDKVKEHVLKNKKIFVLYLCISCIIILAAAIIYKTDFQEAMLQPRNVMTVKDELGSPGKFVTLTGGLRIEQKITMVSEEFSGFSLWLEKNSIERDAEISVQLRNETGRLVEDWIISTDEIIGNNFFDFFFSEINVNVGDVYSIVIEADSKERISVPMGLKKFSKTKKNVLLSEMETNKRIKFEEPEDTFCLAYRILDGDCGALRFFYLIFVIMIALLIGSVYVLVATRQKKEWIFVFMSLILGGIYILIFPPYMVPDDEAHFVTAYAESSAILGETVRDEEGYVILEQNAANSLVRKEFPDRSSYATYIRGIFGKESVVSSDEVVIRGALNIKSLGYVPQIVGLVIGRLLNVNNAWLFILGRVMALLLYCFVMFWAIRIIPEFGKNILFLVGLLPMTIQQVASFNYDSVLFDALFFLFAYILFLAFDPGKTIITLKDYIVVVALIVVIVPIKFVYIPLLGLALLVPKEKFGGQKKKIFSAVSAGVLCALVLFVTRLSSSGPLIKAVTTDTETYTLMECIQEPVQTFVMFFKTIGHYGTLYLQSMIGAPLGWFEIGIPSIIIDGFVILLLFSLLECQGSHQWKKWERIWFILLISGIAFLIFLALLQDWTLRSSKYIEGVQGRYFIPLLPVFLLALKNKTVILAKKADTFFISGILSLQVLTVLSVVSVVVNRGTF